jgi:hypothetical protein
MTIIKSFFSPFVSNFLAYYIKIIIGPNCVHVISFFWFFYLHIPGSLLFLFFVSFLMYWFLPNLYILSRRRESERERGKRDSNRIEYKQR